jgi:hypothetical protein
MDTLAVTKVLCDALAVRVVELEKLAGDLAGDLAGRHTAITKRRYLPTTNDVW